MRNDSIREIKIINNTMKEIGCKNERKKRWKASSTRILRRGKVQSQYRKSWLNT